MADPNDWFLMTLYLKGCGIGNLTMMQIYFIDQRSGAFHLVCLGRSQHSYRDKNKYTCHIEDYCILCVNRHNYFETEFFIIITHGLSLFGSEAVIYQLRFITHARISQITVIY